MDALQVAEVPESDPGEPTNSDEPEQASKESDEPKQEQFRAAGADTGEPSEEKKEEVEDDGDHMVEGDEDTVIY